MIDDLDDPTGQLLPFILHSRVSLNMFDHYFCWMMVDRYDDDMHDEHQ